MCMRIKRIISCIIFLVLLIFAIGKCADILEQKSSRQKYEAFFKSETNFDVIFLGTSHMWNSILPMELWDEYGISSFNWGYSNCTPAESYYLIREIVEYTNPKVVVLDVYGIIEYDGFNNGKYRNDRIEQRHVQFDQIPLSINKIEAVEDIFDDYEDRVDFLWNFAMYHNRWNELGKADFDYCISTEKGADYLTGVGYAEFEMIPKDEKMEIKSVCYDYFLNILEFCEQKNIKVLCTYLPYAAPEKQQRVANSIGDIINDYSGCSYINMLDKGILNFKTDIYEDNSHLNYSGAQKVTSWLGEYLCSNYVLEDYSNNKSWKQDYQAYYEAKVSELKRQDKLVNYLCLLSDPDFESEIVVYDEKILESELIMEQISNANLKLTLFPENSDKCAKIIIKSNISEEIIEEVCFVYEDIFSEETIIESK